MVLIIPLSPKSLGDPYGRGGKGSSSFCNPPPPRKVSGRLLLRLMSSRISNYGFVCLFFPGIRWSAFRILVIFPRSTLVVIRVGGIPGFWMLKGCAQCQPVHFRLPQVAAKMGDRYLRCPCSPCR